MKLYVLLLLSSLYIYLREKVELFWKIPVSTVLHYNDLRVAVCLELWIDLDDSSLLSLMGAAVDNNSIASSTKRCTRSKSGYVDEQILLVLSRVDGDAEAALAADSIPPPRILISRRSRSKCKEDADGDNGGDSGVYADPFLILGRRCGTLRTTSEEAASFPSLHR